MTPPKLVTKWWAWGPPLLSVLRIVAAFMFSQAGTMKLFAFPAGIPPNGGTVPWMSEMGVAGILETFGGGLLLLGLFTRPVAFLLSGEEAVAYFQVSFPQGFWPLLNGALIPRSIASSSSTSRPLAQGRGVWIRSGEATQLETAPAAVV